MKIKKEDKIKVFAISLAMGVGIIVFVTTFIRAVFYAPEREVEIDAITLQASTSGKAQILGNTSVAGTATSTGAVGVHPRRLVIPVLGVNANVQQAGITQSGNMGIPTNFTDVALYKYGPIPGQDGNAVFSGHVDNGLSLPGVFKQLNKLREGDEVYVVSENGKELQFRVSSIAYYDYKNVPTKAIFSSSGDPKIVLITCGGKWLGDARTYDQRVVVTATLFKA